MPSGKIQYTAEIDGLKETLRALNGLETDLRRQANGELRKAAGDCARGLVDRLKTAAAACGVPVAPDVASSVRVKSDRLPVVSIGGPKRIGRNKVPAGRLLWGSEQGPKSDPNHFAVPPGPGYWIKPTVARFQASDAERNYRAAVYAILKRYGLV